MEKICSEEFSLRSEKKIGAIRTDDEVAVLLPVSHRFFFFFCLSCEFRTSHNTPVSLLCRWLADG